MSDKIEISLEYDGGAKKLVFPINPDALRIDTGSASETLTVIGIGEVSLPRTPALANLTITSFFWNKVGATVDDNIDPDECVQWVREWQSSKKSADLVVKGLAHFSMRVSCESFWFEKRAGEEGATYFELKLKEYREYGAQKLTSNGATSDDFVLAIYAETPTRYDNRKTVPNPAMVGDDVSDGNAVAIASETDSIPYLIYDANADKFDVEEGEFPDLAQLTVPEAAAYGIVNDVEADEIVQKYVEAKFEKAMSDMFNPTAGLNALQGNNLVDII